MPGEATYPLEMSKKGGCEKNDTQAYVISESAAAEWEHNAFEPLKMIFICPITLKQKEPKDGDSQENTKKTTKGMDHVQGPVELRDGRRIRESDSRHSLCGAPMVLIHELLHSQLMKANGGEPRKSTLSSERSKYTNLPFCWR